MNKQIVSISIVVFAVSGCNPGSDDTVRTLDGGESDRVDANHNAVLGDPKESDAKESDTISFSADCSRPVGGELCTSAQICQRNACGGMASFFSADGCLRKDCVGSGDCDERERCFHSALALGVCVPSSLGICMSSCACGTTADCSSRTARCVSLEEAPVSTDCDVGTIVGCDKADESLRKLDYAIGEVRWSSEVNDGLKKCRVALQTRRQELNCMN